MPLSALSLTAENPFASLEAYRNASSSAQQVGSFESNASLTPINSRSRLRVACAKLFQAFIRQK